MKATSKVSIGLTLVALAFFVSSCEKSATPEEQVKQFAINFAEKVSKNQKDSLTAIWPDVVKADSLALAFAADSISVEPTQTAGQYKVNFGNADMLVTMAEDGKMTVSETHGIYAWPADDIDFAKKTGQWKDGLNDLEQAERMGDKEFKTLVTADFSKKMQDALKAEKKIIMIKDQVNPPEPGIMAAIIRNNSDIDISGTDYQVIFKIGTLYGGMEDISDEEKPGKDISAKDTVQVTCYWGLHNSPIEARVKMKLSNEQLFNKYFKATGNEYEDYLKTKGTE